MQLTQEDYDLAVQIARSMTDRSEKPPVTGYHETPANGVGDRPGDEYNRQTAWSDILLPAGWTFAGQQGTKCYWRRPGKKPPGISATTGFCQSEGSGDLLYVFSTNAHPFESERSYSRFAAYAILNHGGDFTSAARELGKNGYGKQEQEIPFTRGTTTNRQAKAEEKDAGPAFDPNDIATLKDLATAGASIRWVWPGWWQKGILEVVGANAGIGKTRFMADLIRRVQFQLPWPDGQPMTLPADSKFMWVASDNNHDELVSLCQAFGIEDNVVLNASKSDPYGGVLLETPRQLAELEARVLAVKPAGVIIDTIGNSTDKDLCRQEEAKRYFQPLQIMARKSDTTVFALAHLSLSGSIYGIRSLEKVRLALRLEAPDPEGQVNRRKLEITKSNAKKPSPLGVTMGDLGNEYDNTPPVKPINEPGKRGPDPVKLNACKEWLLDWLKCSPKRVSITRTEANRLNFNVETLYRAKDQLNVEQFEAENYKWWQLTSKESE